MNSDTYIALSVLISVLNTCLLLIKTTIELTITIVELFQKDK